MQTHHVIIISILFVLQVHLIQFQYFPKSTYNGNLRREGKTIELNEEKKTTTYLRVFRNLKATTHPQADQHVHRMSNIIKLLA